MDGWLASQVALWVLALLVCILALAVVRLTRGLEFGAGKAAGPPAIVGQRFAPLTLRDVVSGEQLSVPSPRRSSIVVFVSPTCVECRHVMPVVAQLNEHYAREADTLVLASAERSALSRYAESLRARLPILADETGEVIRGFGISHFPYAVVMTPNGEVHAAAGLTTANAGQELMRLLDVARRVGPVPAT